MMNFGKRFIFTAPVIVFFCYVMLKSPGKVTNHVSGKVFYKEKPSYITHRRCVNSTKPKPIFYIKIQKTGSSTIKSSLFNYGMKHNLRICHDNTDLYHMNFPYRIDESKLTRPYYKKCELIAEELVFDYKQALRLMTDRPIIVASVRDPIKHFISMYKFARVHGAVQMLTLLKLDFWDGVRIFLKNPELVRNVYNTYDKEEIPDFAVVNIIRPSLQAFNLGLSPTATNKEIEKISRDIKLLIVTDKFHESIVLLAEELCCPLDDLVFVHQNIQRKIPAEQEAIPDDVRTLIEIYNAADVKLYKLALKRLQVGMKKNVHFESDLEKYKSVIKHYSSECRISNKPLAMVDGNFCLPEMPTFFYQLVRKKQRKKLLEELQTRYNELNNEK